MKHRRTFLAVSIAVALVLGAGYYATEQAFYAGYAYANRLDSSIDTAYTVGALYALRRDDPARAVRMLELQLDAAVGDWRWSHEIEPIAFVALPRDVAPPIGQAPSPGNMMKAVQYRRDHPSRPECRPGVGFGTGARCSPADVELQRLWQLHADEPR